MRRIALLVLALTLGAAPALAAPLTYLEKRPARFFGTVDIVGTLTLSGGITLSGTLTMDETNLDTVDNLVDDMIEFQGVGGTDNTDLRFDLDGTHPVLDSPTDGRVEIAEPLTVSGAGGVTLENSESLHASTNSAFTFVRNDAGVVTLTCADNDATCALTLDPGGAAALVLGSADVLSHTFTTDGTGTAEVALPAGSIDGTEVLDATLTCADTDDAAGADGIACEGGVLVWTGAHTHQANVTHSDGAGNSPSMIFTPQTGASWSIFGEDVSNVLQVETSTATADAVDFNNTGAGTISLTLDGSITSGALFTSIGATTYDSGGATGITIGSADVLSVTLTTDGTGTGEVVLPLQSIGAAEIVNDTINGSELADTIALDAAFIFTPLDNTGNAWQLGGDRPAITVSTVNNQEGIIFEGSIDFRGFGVETPSATTVADNTVGASPATVTIEVIPGLRMATHITCNDPDGCNVTMGETPAPTNGTVFRIVNVSANVCNFADTAGVTELSGAFAAGQWDVILLSYAVDRWVEDGRSNN